MWKGYFRQWLDSFKIGDLWQCWWWNSRILLLPKRGFAQNCSIVRNLKRALFGWWILLNNSLRISDLLSPSPIWYQWILERNATTVLLQLIWFPAILHRVHRWTSISLPSGFLEKLRVQLIMYSIPYRIECQVVTARWKLNDCVSENHLSCDCGSGSLLANFLFIANSWRSDQA